MKKLFAVLLTVTLLISSAASANTFSSLGELQRFIMKYSPDAIAARGPHYVEISGTIMDIRYANQSNHYEMTLAVEDSRAFTALGYDSPIITVHFRRNTETFPYNVGDEIDVFGTLNDLYSSVMIPMILAKTINGSDDW